MKIDVCICTHSPSVKKLSKAVAALAAQTVSKDRFQVWVIDNASLVPIRETDSTFDPLRQAGIAFQVLQEAQIGVAHARVRALRSTTADAVLFVDDDNYLSPLFIEESLRVLEQHPEVGVFSGRMHLPEETRAPRWLWPWLLGLAIKDLGISPIIGWYYGYWEAWVPVATASMVLRRSVAEAFLKTYAVHPDFYRLGRRGKISFASGEDAVIAKTASDVGLQCGYFPKLLMFHDISPERFRFSYIFRLNLGFGISDYWQFRVAGVAPRPFTKKYIQEMTRPLWSWHRRVDLRIRISHIAWSIAACISWIRLHLYQARTRQPAILRSSESP